MSHIDELETDERYVWRTAFAVSVAISHRYRDINKRLTDSEISAEARELADFAVEAFRAEAGK